MSIPKNGSLTLLLIFLTCMIYLIGAQIDFSNSNFPNSNQGGVLGNLDQLNQPHQPNELNPNQGLGNPIFGNQNPNMFNYKNLNWNNIDRRAEEDWWHLYPFGERYFDIDVADRPWMDKQVDLDFFLPFYGFRFNYSFIFPEGFVSFGYPWYIQPPYTFPNPSWPNKQDPSFIAPFMSPQSFASIGEERLSKVWYRIVQRPNRFVGFNDDNRPNVGILGDNDNYGRREQILYKLSDGKPSRRTYGTEVLGIKDGRVDDPHLLDTIQRDIQTGMVGARGFQPDYALIITWERMAYGGAPKELQLQNYRQYKKWQNTYQMVIATDEIRTFTMFNYGNINWTSSTEGGSLAGRGGRQSAVVGFNGGNGTGFFKMPYSGEGDSYKLVQFGSSNVAGRWLARVDENIYYGGCTNASEGTLQVSENYVSMLGGFALNVSGPCFRPGNTVKVQLDILTIDCTILDQVVARCVFPTNELYITGMNEIKLSIDGGREYNFWNKNFYLVTPGRDRVTVNLLNDPNKPHNDWRRIDGDNLTLTWPAYNLTWQQSKFVDIDLYGYWEDTTEFKFEKIGSLARRAQNSGSYYFNPQQLTRQLIEQKHQDDVIYDPEPWKKFNFGVVRVRLSDDWMGTEGDGTFWSSMVPFGFYFNQMWEYEHGRDWAMDKCVEWFEYDGRLINYMQHLDPYIACPCSLDQALMDIGRFQPVAECNNWGDSRCLYQQGSLHCVVSTKPSWTGASQMCCYDNNGWLMFTQDFEYSEKYLKFFSAGFSSRAHPFGGFPYRRPPFIPGLSHYFNDLMPYDFCCRYAGHCELFYWRRETSTCQNYRPARAGFAYGDPHFITYDGLQYSFNGKGYFVLTEMNIPKTVDLMVQVRMEEPPKTVWNAKVRATVITGVAARDNSSAVIEIYARKDFRRWRYKMDVYVDQQQIFFDTPWQKYQHFHGVALFSPQRNLNTSEIHIQFHTGVGVRVQEASGILDVMVTLPPIYNESWPHHRIEDFYRRNEIPPKLTGRQRCDQKYLTKGLLGVYNGDPRDDLTDPDCNEISARYHSQRDPSYEDMVYEQFGMKYMVGTKNNKYKLLFSEKFKPINDPPSFADYRGLGFQVWTPIFSPSNYPGIGNASFIFTVPQVEIECQGKYSCIYDYLVTGRREYGLNTLKQETSNLQLKQKGEVELISCGPLQKNMGVVKFPIGNNYLQGVTVTFTCKSEYFLHGDTTRSCGNGTWSDGWWAWCRDRTEEYALKYLTGILVSLMILGLIGAILCWCYCIYVKGKGNTSRRSVRYRANFPQPVAIVNQKNLVYNVPLHAQSEPVTKATPIAMMEGEPVVLGGKDKHGSGLVYSETRA